VQSLRWCRPQKLPNKLLWYVGNCSAWSTSLVSWIMLKPSRPRVWTRFLSLQVWYPYSPALEFFFERDLRHEQGFSAWGGSKALEGYYCLAHLSSFVLFSWWTHHGIVWICHTWYDAFATYLSWCVTHGMMPSPVCNIPSLDLSHILWCLHLLCSERPLRCEPMGEILQRQERPQVSGWWICRVH